MSGQSASQAGAGDEDEWEDEGDWKVEGNPTPHKVGTLPEGWTCEIGKGQTGKFLVAYCTDDGTVVTSKSELRKYLNEKRPDLDAANIVDSTNFSQRFARRAFIMGVEKRAVGEDAGDSGSQADHTGAKNVTREQGGAETGAASSMPDTSRDEMIARTMQAAFDDEYRHSGMPVRGFHMDSDDSDPDWSGDELVGDVAAGGWRMRQAEHDEETAEDYDISCLEIRTVPEGNKEEGHCPVCQEEWKEGDQQRVLPCEHRFHTSCVDRWLKDHKAQCPLCKKDVREDWVDEEEEVWDPVAGKWVSVGGQPSRRQDPPPGAEAEGEEDDNSNASWETVDEDEESN